MQFIEPNVEILKQTSGLDGLYKQIELAGRTCYKSFDKITPNSAKEFTERMIKSNHGAMLEHATVYLAIPNELAYDCFGENWIMNTYYINPYSYVNNTNNIYYITTNYRVLIENNWLTDLRFLSDPTEFHQKRITVRVTTNIGVTREYNRHRVNSIAEQSTRLCNYMREKFGMSISYCKPYWFDENNMKDFWQESLPLCCPDEDGSQCTPEFYFIRGKNDKYSKESWTAEDYYMFAAQVSEFCYKNILRLGLKPQDARSVLLLSTATEAVYTASIHDWEHFFSLRSSKCNAKGVHPEAAFLANIIYDKFLDSGFITLKKLKYENTRKEVKRYQGFI